MAEFPGHKYGINCVAFAPNNKYIVSVSLLVLENNIHKLRHNSDKIRSNQILKLISPEDNVDLFNCVQGWQLEVKKTDNANINIMPLLWTILLIYSRSLYSLALPVQSWLI